jgi:hypothetical protein
MLALFVVLMSWLVRRILSVQANTFAAMTAVGNIRIQPLPGQICRNSLGTFQFGDDGHWKKVGP